MVFSLIVLINLLFIPMISIYIHYKRNNEKISFTPTFAVKYCIFAVAVFLLAKIGAEFVSLFHDIAIPPVDAYYTIFAVPAAVVFPYLIEMFKKFRVKVKIENDSNEKNDEKSDEE